MTFSIMAVVFDNSRYVVMVMKGSWLTWSLSSIVVLDVSSSVDCKKQNEIALIFI
jgi:hypothetical protein